MGGEIVTIQVGQCGIQTGLRFWSALCSEHSLDGAGQFIGASPDDQLDRIGVFFQEGAAGRFVPRCILADLDARALVDVAGLFSPDDFVVEAAGAGASNNFAKGAGAGDVADDVMEGVRRQAESSDNLQGFQLWHALGGGTGSGLGAVLAQQIHDQYEEAIVSDVAVWPSSNSDVVVEPYNATLAFASLMESSDETFVVDNGALYAMVARTEAAATTTGSSAWSSSSSSYSSVNSVVSLAMAGVTAPMRLPGIVTTDLRKMVVNLCPFPRLHFFTIGSAPLVTTTTTTTKPTRFRAATVAELTKQVFNPHNTLSGGRGRLLAASALFRGHISTSDVDNNMMAMRDRHQELFCDWIPSNIQTSICDRAPRGLTMAATLLGNGTSVCALFDRIGEQFKTMLSRKAFLHWYTAEGVDEVQFAEAERDLHDASDDYRQYNTTPTND